MKSASDMGIASFSEILEISRSTAKRLFENQVFPEAWVSKTEGGHWRIKIDEKKMQEAQRRLHVWKIISRKPLASKIKSIMDGDPLVEIEKIIKDSDVQGGLRMWQEKVNASELAAVHIFTIVWKIKRRLGMDYEPRPREIAQEMSMSLSSLYRQPFGSEAIAAAKDLFALYEEIT